MPFRPEILATDILIWFLVAVVAFFAWYARRHEHLRAAWARVGHSKTGMAAATVLLFFVVLGLLDSLHFRLALHDQEEGRRVYAVEVLSILDKLAGPIRTNKEKTYSAPLATHLFAKETIELPDGRQVRDYPRLKFGGAHLEDPAAEWAADVSLHVAWGVVAGVAAWLALALLLCALLARRRAQTIGRMWRAIWGNETGMSWDAVLIAMAGVLLLAGPVLALAAGYHVFGTDKIGQDVLFLALKSIRTGLVIGTLATLIMLPFALAFGTMAGYFRGVVDDAIQYFYTTLSSIPGVLLIAAAVLMMHVYIETHAAQFETTTQRADFRLLWLCVILGVMGWVGLCRLLRGESLKLREMEYIQAARAFGVSDFRIIFRHIVPNVMHIVLIVAVLDFSGLVLAEAVLAYIGIGVDPSMTSFGGMINSARLEMARDPMVWWLLAAAFFFMLGIVLSANLFADAVRDAFDPRIRSRTGSAERLRQLASEKA
jgi:peptide/nickel transport system permease protein